MSPTAGGGRPGNPRAYKDGALLHITVWPNTRKNALEIGVGVCGQLTAAPAKGETKAHYIQYLSGRFRFPKSRMEIVRGRRSKGKWPCFKNLAPDERAGILCATKEHAH